MHKNYSKLKNFIKNRFNINSKNGFYLTIGVVLGADINAKDIKGNTALMWATKCGNTDIAESLKEAGAKN